MTDHDRIGSRTARPLWRGLGLFLFALGAVGAVLPLLPTTVFWILALVCFGKAGDARAERLLNHPRFGATLHRFVEEGSLTRAAKLSAFIGMSAGAAALLPVMALSSAVASCGWLVLALSAAYVGTRPEPNPAAVLANGLHANGRLRALPEP